MEQKNNLVSDDVYSIVKNVYHRNFDGDNILDSQSVEMVVSSLEQAESEVEELKSIDKQVIDSFVFDCEDYLGLINSIILKGYFKNLDDYFETTRDLLRFRIPKKDKIEELSGLLLATCKSDVHDSHLRDYSFIESELKKRKEKYSKVITKEHIQYLLNNYSSYIKEYYHKNIEYKIYKSKMF